MKLLYLVESGESKFLVFDEMPDKISTKYGDDTIIGRIGGIFYDFFAKRNERREAFGGRKFDIVQLLDDDSREESGSGTYYERECDALFDIDGRGNTERLVARNPKLRNLLEDGEYIPSLGQLNLMAHYMDELNKAFAYVSASPLSSTWYWSSTESSQAVAWYVVFSSGLTGTGNKHIGDMVRTVIDF